MSDLESALQTVLETALQQMPKEAVEAIVRKILDAHPAPDVFPHLAMILHHANPAYYYYKGFRARFSFKCVAGKVHEDTTENLWVGRNHDSEIRDVVCNCGVTPVKFIRPQLT